MEQIGIFLLNILALLRRTVKDDQSTNIQLFCSFFFASPYCLSAFTEYVCIDRNVYMYLQTYENMF